jgi:outer membrane protein OmpA-like peptidoglycan-associated protein
MVVVALLAIVGPASARFNSPTLLYQIPTADVLPAGALAISADLTYPLVNTPKNVNYPEADVNLLFSPVKGLNVGLTGYTFADWALDLKYQILGGGDPAKFGLALGVYDIGLNEYVSPVGHGLDDVWPDWRYNVYLPRYNRSTERFSAYAVTSIPLAKFARLHLGLGRGRFVGYAERSKYLNTDYFFDEYHQWAFGLFGGAEVFLIPQVALVAEASGRDLNAGVRASFDAFTATVAWTKMEGLLFDEGDARFGRLEVGVSYRREKVPQPPAPEIRPFQQEPAPEPEELPVAVAPEEVRLDTIWFDWDKWGITPVADAALRRNAMVLLAHPDLRVVITGYASREGSPERNTTLARRRAMVAFEYLKVLGVPAEQMRFRVMGESAGRPNPMHRAAYFEIEAEK